MKKFLLFFLVAALPTVVFGQKNPSWRKTDDQWAKKNSITATATALILSNTSYYGLGYCLGIEYDRMIAYNLSLSAIAAYSPSDIDASTINEIFYFAGIKANYNCP